MLIWMVYIFNYWPFKRACWKKPTRPKRGHPDVHLRLHPLRPHQGLLQGLLGNFGIAYFNPGRLMQLPGMTEFFALEYASLPA